MAICSICEREMIGSTTCRPVPVELVDGVFEQVRYGDERRFGRATSDSPCHDCGVMRGGFHHRGCDMEECPNCRGQLFACYCLKPGEEDEDWGEAESN